MGWVVKLLSSACTELQAEFPRTTIYNYRENVDLCATRNPDTIPATLILFAHDRTSALEIRLVTCFWTGILVFFQFDLPIQPWSTALNRAFLFDSRGCWCESRRLYGWDRSDASSSLNEMDWQAKVWWRSYCQPLEKVFPHQFFCFSHMVFKDLLLLSFGYLSCFLFLFPLQFHSFRSATSSLNHLSIWWGSLWPLDSCQFLARWRSGGESVRLSASQPQWGLQAWFCRCHHNIHDFESLNQY